MKNAIHNHLTVKNDICFRMSRPTSASPARRGRRPETILRRRPRKP
jgi:hypothetical protein